MKARETLGALAAGLLFGAGLIVSGMTDPAKVLAFLDVAGAWDPSLALVMVGAIGAAHLGYRATGRLDHGGGRVDAPLLIGSALFGAGWGLAGYCPGPAVVAGGALSPAAWILLPALLAGLWLTERWLARGPVEKPAQ
ncbi:hypothetical protein E6C76_02515 [Pseudothauera nasutitermitis]|uniref:YeeE/YedE family protein n=1 Tax=Pseudothauera nasutitermitis TaxID=2565930 RepID=A0A4S4B3M1_9RHOO|nr:DUF6691 family protein [Pseudothauera nasutitermitis]THF67270.1 hypothetical protein E6C76_02515 [Pseudothauera nasutitermitis]